MRRLLALTAIALAAVLHSPADAAAPVQSMGLHLAFNGTGSGTYVVQGLITTDAKHPGLLASVDAVDSSAFFPEVTELGSDGAVTTYGGAAAGHSLCALPAVCTLSEDRKSLSFSYSWTLGGDGGTPFHWNAYLVAQGARVTMAHTGVGAFTVTRLAGWSRVTDSKAATAGLRAAGTDVELDQTVTAQGGPRGSVAIAVPPCDLVGAGVATFTGATSGTQTVLCPTAAVAGVAAKKTTWSLSGAMAGASGVQTRLLVLPR